jgi:hypothetical protein
MNGIFKWVEIRSIYNFAWGLLKAFKKSIFSTSTVKKNSKSHKGSIRRSLQAQPKTIQKLSKQINQSKQKKSQIKVCLVLQKWKQAKNLYGGYPVYFFGK